MRNVIPYRADIDGLRAVAVLLVLLFHADLGVPGGFIGVDVFFVISGYLITGLIWRKLEKGDFSLRDFWIRRIRRILPAQLVVLAFVVIAASILFLPIDRIATAKTAQAQSLMLANVQLWLQSGYFEPAAEESPLLHFWSLAVEEQFYLFYPFLLYLTWKLAKRHVLAVIYLIGFASFALSIYGTYRYPGATFYLLPTRAWELLVGAVVAVQLGIQSSESTKVTSFLKSYLGILGISMIFAAAFFYDDEMRFPGLAALLPCVGAAFVIMGGHFGSGFTTRTLTLSPIVGVGLISYSLYLWHWPLLVFSNYWSIDELLWYWRLSIVIASFPVAWLSWKYVEQPFRRSLEFTQSQRYVVRTAVACNFVVFFLMAAVRLPIRQPWIPNLCIEYANASSDTGFLNEVSLNDASLDRFPSVGLNQIRDVDLVIWGDSHAMAATPVIDDLCRRNRLQGKMASHSSTAPLAGFILKSPWGLNDQAPAFAEEVIRFVEERSVKHVILIGLWSNYITQSDQGITDGDFDSCLHNTIKRLELSGVSVAIMLEVPRQHTVNIPRLLARETLFRRGVSHIGVTLDDHRARTRTDLLRIKAAAGESVTILDPAATLAGSDNFCEAAANGRALYRDDAHLTVQGAMRLRPMFVRYIDAVGDDVRDSRRPTSRRSKSHDSQAAK